MNQDKVPVTTLAIAAILSLAMGALAVAQESDTQTVPGLDELRQESMLLKQDILTANADERQAVSNKAQQLMRKFDRRIEALQDTMSERGEAMSESARRYSNELIAAMGERRAKVGDWIDDIRGNTEETWDHIAYRFSRAYDAFYESWEDVESNLGLEAQ